MKEEMGVSVGGDLWGGVVRDFGDVDGIIGYGVVGNLEVEEG